MKKRRLNSPVIMLVICCFMLSVVAVTAHAQQTIAPPDAPKSATAAAAPQSVATSPVDRPDKKGWPERHEKINERIKQGNVDLIFIGDSIIQAWESKGKDVWKKYYAKRNAANLGINGDHTEHVLWRLDNGNIDGISPKLAVVMIGTNNASSKLKPEQIAAGNKAIVDKLRAKLPQTKILLLAIFPRGGDDEDPKHDANAQANERNMKANEIIAKLADDKMVFYMDINDKFLDSDQKLLTDIMPDFLHPNAKGYELWAEAIEPKVAELMGEK